MSKKKKFQGQIGTIEYCEWHTPSLNYSYLGAEAAYLAKISKGDKQKHCEDCGCFLFPDEWGTKP